MLLPRQVNRELAFSHKQDCLGIFIRFGLFATTTCFNFHNVLGKSFGKPGQGTRQNPRTRFDPMRQSAGDNILHDAFRDHCIGICKYRAAG